MDIKTYADKTIPLLAQQRLLENLPNFQENHVLC